MDGQSGLKILYTNIQSVNNKINELRAVISSERPDVVAITESWTNENIDDKCLKVEGYDMVVRKDRVDTVGGRGGGILIYVKGMYVWKEDNESTFNQCAKLNVKKRSGEFGICVVYRSPNSDRDNDMMLCQWIREMRGDNIILGDFNLESSGILAVLMQGESHSMRHAPMPF